MSLKFTINVGCCAILRLMLFEPLLVVLQLDQNSLLIHQINISPMMQYKALI
jgi:hypothetical protein